MINQPIDPIAAATASAPATVAAAETSLGGALEEVGAIDSTTTAASETHAEAASSSASPATRTQPQDSSALSPQAQEELQLQQEEEKKQTVQQMLDQLQSLMNSGKLDEASDLAGNLAEYVREDDSDLASQMAQMQVHLDAGNTDEAANLAKGVSANIDTKVGNDIDQ